MGDVIQLHRVPPGLEGQLQPGEPYLTYDPATKLWGIIVDNVEVISGLDPIGIRERIRRAAQSEGKSDE